MAAEKKAGIRHHLALSIVGIPQMQESGYMRGKKLQEDLIAQSGIPHTIIRSTQSILGAINFEAWLASRPEHA